MKITFVNSCPYLGGAEIWHLRTALKLKERGHAMSMIARGPLAERAREAGLPTLELPLSCDLDLASFFRALAFFRANRPDLILLNDQRECRLIAPAAALAGIKVRLQRKGWPFIKGSWRDKIVYKYFVTGLIAASGDIARVFRQKNVIDERRITVLGNGVDLARFQPRGKSQAREKLGLPAGAIVIGSLGRLVSQKGFSDLVTAAGQTARQHPSLHLIIGGDGEEKEKLEALANSSGLGARARFPGRIEDSPAFLSALDLFAFPSYSEGRSNAVMEAMATGLPIAASDIPGNRELIEDGKTGLIYPAGDASALARALERLIADSALAANLGRAAHDFARENLDLEKALDRLVSHFEDQLRGISQ